jgi:hypothetical protein
MEAAMALWRDPLDELIEELDQALPPAPDEAGWDPFPVAQLHLALAGVFEGRPPTPDQERFMARFVAHLEALGKRRGEDVHAKKGVDEDAS